MGLLTIQQRHNFPSLVVYYTEFTKEEMPMNILVHATVTHLQISYATNTWSHDNEATLCLAYTSVP